MERGCSQSLSLVSISVKQPPPFTTVGPLEPKTFVRERQRVACESTQRGTQHAQEHFRLMWNT
jgi:hypothetical protein